MQTLLVFSKFVVNLESISFELNLPRTQKRLFILAIGDLVIVSTILMLRPNTAVGP